MRKYPRIPPDDERCSKPNVADDSGWHLERCKRRGVVKEDSKLWCKQHSPSAVAKRKQDSAARWQAQQDAMMAPYRQVERLETINRDLLAALEALVALAKPKNGRRKRLHPALENAEAAIAKAKLPA